MLKRTVFHYPLLTVMLFAATLLAASAWLGLRDAGLAGTLRELLAANPLLGVLAFCLLFALGNLAQIPGWIFLVAAVWTFGPIWGGLITYAAAVFSCAAGFRVIERIGGDALRQFKGTLMQRILGQLDRRPLRTLIALRLLFQTAPALNYALALSGVRARDNLFGALLGLPLPIATYCLAFDLLVRWLGIGVA